MYSLRSFWPARYLIALTVILAFGLSFSAPGNANDVFNLPKSNNTLSLLPASDDFLPVTDAFQLQGTLNGPLLTLTWQIAPDYYLYEERFRFRPDQQLTLTPQFDEGITKFDEFFEKDMTVFYRSASIRLELPEHQSPLYLQVESQGCADAGLCYPPHTDYLRIDTTTGSVAVVDALPTQNTSTTPAAPVAEASSLWLLQALFLALAGGIILNLMPCVFPVLSIKVMSLAEADRSRLALHGWAYTFGVVFSFLLLAVILLVLRAGGEAIGWGFQLQSPLLVAGLAYLFFIMGMALSGHIAIGKSWMGAGESLTRKSGLTGSFFTGVLAAVVASPCTAPFMGAALGFALTQPGYISLAVFAALGFGMALPLLLLCYLPSLTRFLPKPGAWMETFKELLAFPLYLTAIWLLWVLGRQAGINTAIAACVGALLIAFGFWLLARQGNSVKRLIIVLLVAVSWLTAALLPWKFLPHESDESWQRWSASKVTELRREGKPVFVNLTADWCLTCLANERLVLSSDEIDTAFKDAGVVRLKGDWTNTDPEITALLQEYGRSGVPLYLWFPADHQGPGIILPQLLTRKMIHEALN